MSRSYKKTPGFYITCSANKPHVRSNERKEYNRRWRRNDKQRLNIDLSDIRLVRKHDEIANKWDMIQDGDYIIWFSDMFPLWELNKHKRK